MRYKQSRRGGSAARLRWLEREYRGILFATAGFEGLEDCRAKFIRVTRNGTHRKAAESAFEDVGALVTGGHAQDGGGRLNATDIVLDGVRGRLIVGAEKHQLRPERIKQSHAFVGLRIALQGPKDKHILRQ
jgi:hypothetical protein